MKFEKFNLAESQSAEKVAQLHSIFSGVEGVIDVEILGESGECKVLFDSALLTRAALEELMRNENFLVEKSAHGSNGVCCGSCGSCGG